MNIETILFIYLLNTNISYCVDNKILLILFFALKYHTYIDIIYE